MSKSEIITILAVLVLFAVVATAPFNLLTYHAEFAAIFGAVGFVTTLLTVIDELRGYRIKITRKGE